MRVADGLRPPLSPTVNPEIELYFPTTQSREICPLRLSVQSSGFLRSVGHSWEFLYLEIRRHTDAQANHYTSSARDGIS